MSHVWHLVRHDLRAHRTILLAWLAIVVALPVFALLPWSDQVAAGFGVGGALVLQGARVLLGLAAIAAIVQAGSPIDDRSFWRTRPVAPATLAAAHLLTVGVTIVVVPVLVVFAVTVGLGIPRAHWLPSLAQVCAVECALAGFGLVIASRTRSIATFIVAAVVGLASMFFLLGALAELRRLLQWPGLVQMADPLKALWAMIAITGLLLPVLFVLAMAGPRRQRAFLAGVLGVLVLCVGVWFVPALRFAPPPLIDANLSFTAASVRVEPVPDAPGAGTLVLVATPTHTLPRDHWRLSLKRGRLVTSSGTRWLKAPPPGYTPRMTAPQVPVVIAVLSASEFKALAGTPVRLEVELQGDVDRSVTEARAALTPGAFLATDHQQLSVRGLLDGVPDPVRRMRPAVDALEVSVSSFRFRFRHAHTYVMRDRARGCEQVGASWPSQSSSVMRLALLPTVMPPFTARRVELAEWTAGTCRLDLRNTDIEIRSVETQAVRNVPVSLEFTLPSSLP